MGVILVGKQNDRAKSSLCFVRNLFLLRSRELIRHILLKNSPLLGACLPVGRGGDEGEGKPNWSSPFPPPPSPSPIEGGGNSWRDLKYSLLIFNVHTIMD